MKQKEFRISGEYIELIKLLKLLGIAESGAHAKFLVEEGKVMLNGKPETRKRAKLKAGDKLKVMEWEIVLIT